MLKREDLAHTGAHKINNALGQALLAKRMGKRRVIAETGAGQHGVATATACALLGLSCDVYMGAEDMQRQSLNVFRMELLGATVRRVDAGSRTLKDAINEAMRDWVASVADSYYLLGSVLGPHPYPLMVREFQSVIGREAKRQCAEQIGRLPHVVIACVGGGSNAMGIFDAFIDDADVRLIGVEAGGHGITPGKHAARFAGGSAGVLQGTRSYVLQDADGNIELDAFGVRGSRLRGRRPRARVAPRLAPRRIRVGRRRGRARGVSAAGARGRDHPRARIRSRGGAHNPGRAVAVQGGDRPREPLRPRRQGRPERAEGARDAGARRAGGALMSRLAQVFTSLNQNRRGGLVTYLTAGDPDAERSTALLLAVARAGADVIEVGVPFSDPLADGPVIQRASERALAAGMSLRGVLDVVRKVRAEVDTPIVLFTYANPVLRMEPRAFARAAADAGVDGVLILDYPVEEAEPMRAVLVDAGLDPIFLISPTTDDDRIRKSSNMGRGFLYVISRLGVTGIRDRLPDGLESLSRGCAHRRISPWRWGSGSPVPSTWRRRAAWRMRLWLEALSSTWWQNMARRPTGANAQASMYGG